MNDDYRKPQAWFSHEIEVKNSRFIAVIAPLTTLEDIEAVIKRTATLWPKASHYCSASILGSPFNPKQVACSDDGEPAGTAGRPMLTVLQNAPLGDVVTVVVRYFGGVKLGTGGLQRAYSQAVAEALSGLQTTWVVYRQQFELTYPYHLQGQIEPLWKQFDVIVLNSSFTDRVSQQLAVTPAQLKPLQSRLRAVSQGQLALSPSN